MQTTTKLDGEKKELSDDILSAMRKVKNHYSRHTLGLNQNPNDGTVTLTLKTRESYDRFQSRPDGKIFLAVHEALKDLDGSMHRVCFSEGTQSDAVKVELRPFDRDRFKEVL